MYRTALEREQPVHGLKLVHALPIRNSRGLQHWLQCSLLPRSSCTIHGMADEATSHGHAEEGQAGTGTGS